MANGSCSLIKERRVGTNKERLVSSTAVSNKSANRNEPGKLDDTIQFPSLRVRKRLYVKGNNFQLLSVKDHETGLQLLHYLFFSEIHANKRSAKLTCVLCVQIVILKSTIKRINFLPFKAGIFLGSSPRRRTRGYPLTQTIVLLHYSKKD